VRSQFWSQLSSFVAIRECLSDRFAGVDEQVQTSVELGLRIWKAGWVQALAGPNPASSAAPLGNASHFDFDLLLPVPSALRPTHPEERSASMRGER
jgi:hypothetical protein